MIRIDTATCSACAVATFIDLYYENVNELDGRQYDRRTFCNVMVYDK